MKLSSQKIKLQDNKVQYIDKKGGYVEVSISASIKSYETADFKKDDEVEVTPDVYQEIRYSTTDEPVCNNTAVEVSETNNMGKVYEVNEELDLINVELADGTIIETTASQLTKM